MQSINPATDQVIETYQEWSTDQTNKAIEAADAAFHEWRQTIFSERAVIMRRAAEVLEQRRPALAKLMAEEMGKPLAEGESEVEKCAWVCRYYADHAASQLADLHIDTDYHVSKVSYQPLGCVFAVMPWNYPLWQVFRFAAPTLMAGNCGLLKHAENVPGSSLQIESVFTEAGLPDGVFTSLLIDKSQAKAVIEHPLIRAVTLTGSTNAGKAVAATAGAVLKKCVLELGGSDAYVVLEDADLDNAVAKCTQSRLLNGGQSCISAKRFLVHHRLLDSFEKQLLENFTARKVGDPFDPDTDIGPMARKDLRDQLHQQVQDSIAAGAKCLVGGEVPEGEGAFYPLTILSNVTPGMPAFDEELFGPVAAITKIDSVEQAIELANQSEFGLGGAIFSQDLDAAELLATQRMDSGACFVNDFVKSDPRLPFGGIKQSGYGRELSHFGIHEFVNIKTVCVQKV